MRIAVVTTFACGLGIWTRLREEGCQVRVWIAHTEIGKVGDGLIPKVGGWGPLLAWAKEGHLSGEPTLVLFDSSGEGEKAEEARRYGLHVIGGGKFMDRLEKDRLFGFEVAKEAGAMLPPYQSFGSFSEARVHALNMNEDTEVYWKSDRYLESDATHKAEGGKDLVEYLDGIIRNYGSHGKCIVQDKIEGVAISTARWWNGRAWVGPYEGTIEHKPAFNDDIGPATGCAVNAVWMYDNDPDIAEALGWEKLAARFTRADAPPGLYDMNVIAGKDGNAYFLEWTPRFGYDSEPTSMRLIPNLAEWYWHVATGQGGEPEFSDEIAYAIRLGVPPYPWEGAKRDQKGAIGADVRGEPLKAGLWAKGFIGYQLALAPHGLYVAAPEGIVGLAYAQASILSDAHEEALETAQALRKTAGLTFRTDGADVIAEDAEAIAAAGFDIHPGLLN